MADSGDHSQLVTGESPESVMSVRSAELSASLKLFYLSVGLNTLAALPLRQLENLTHCAYNAGARHDTHCNFTGGPSAEKKQKQSTWFHKSYLITVHYRHDLQ